MLTTEATPVLRCDRRSCPAVLLPAAYVLGDLFTAAGLACHAVSLGWVKDREGIEAAKWFCPRCALVRN